MVASSGGFPDGGLMFEDGCEGGERGCVGALEKRSARTLEAADDLANTLGHRFEDLQDEMQVVGHYHDG